MYYSILNGFLTKIGMATSVDGITWVRSPSNPILVHTVSWEGNGVYFPSVIYENNTFKMVYMNRSANAFGMATSSDGINWTKDSNNPFFTEDNTANGWADEDIAYPFFMKTENEYRIYYSGIGNPNSSVYKIGFVRKNIN
jgi:predicted GH43/DUF377 family glycosyl hydrolase